MPGGIDESQRQRPFRKGRAAIGLAANVVLSWSVLPFILPCSRGVMLGDFGETMLWQIAGMIGWPMALLAVGFGFLFQPSATGLWASLLLLMYPAILVLLFYVVWSKRPALWAWIALHLLVTASFAAVWYPVLNGYDFMVG